MIREFMRRLNEQGTTIFLTTHYIEEADVLCDRVAMIESGRLVALDSPQNLKAAKREEKTVEVSFDGQVKGIEKEIIRLPNVNRAKKRGDKIRLYTGDPSQTVQAVSGFAEKKELKILSINTLTPTLEDAFVELTGLSSLDMERMEQIGRLRRMKMKGG